MTKRIVATVFVLVLAATGAFIAACGAETALPKGTVAQVGSVTISEKDFNEHVTLYMAAYGAKYEKDTAEYKTFQQQILESMVTYEVVKQKASLLGVSISDAEVAGQIDSILQDSYGGDQAQFDDALKEAGLTLDQLKLLYREQGLTEKAYNQVTLSTKVTDEEIKDYYDEHKADFVVAETRTARHILINPTASRPTTTTASTTSTTAASGASTTLGTTTTTAAATDAEWTAALQEAQKVRELLAAGGDWTKLAAQYSDDPGSKDSGGDLGSISKGDMVAEFDEAAFTLKKGELSQPVKTTYGYHIIEVTGITPKKQQTLTEVTASIKDTLLSENKQAVWEKWLEKAKKELDVLYKEGLKLTTTTTGDATTTTAAGATTVPSATSTSAAGSATTTAPATTTTIKP